MRVSFAQPPIVVPCLELEERLAEVFDGVERPHPEQLLFERADEALGDPVALGLPHEGRARLDPEKLQLVLEVVADVLAAVIVPREQPRPAATPSA